MVRSVCTLLPMAALLLLTGLVSCGGGGDDLGEGSIGDPAFLVPEVTVQNVDHGFRVAGWTDENLDPDPIFNLIASAASSIDIAVTRINRQEIVEALLAEARSGTNIRIVTEKAYYDAPNYQPFYDQLEDQAANLGNIAIHTDLEGLPRLMHSRFMVIDRARVVTGSYNWETNASDYTFGDVISILNTDIANAFTSQFNQMFIEGNFGVHKRDETQHSFVLGSGNGLLEVYFGPTDRPRDLLMADITDSTSVAFAVQQFKDVTLANYLLGWIGSSAENRLVGLFNDIAGLGDNEENAVYEAFASYTQEPLGGELYINTLLDETGEFNQFSTMNHKLIFTDRAFVGFPSVTFTTANFSELGFTLNDEIMLQMRGVPLVKKFWRGVDLTSDMPAEEIDEASDFQEFDQLFAMYPYVPSIDATIFRGFEELPCGIVYGSVDNFRPVVNVADENGDFTEIAIDLRFDVYTDDGDELFFGGILPLTPVKGEDLTFFTRSEALNPDHRFMMVVPAGDVTIVTTVTDLGGSPNLIFEPDEQLVKIAPGGVKEVGLKINQPAAGGGGGGFGGGGI